jgi:hypothetical protein
MKVEDIKKVYKNGNEIPIEKICIIEEVPQFSSTQELIRRLMINGEVVTKRSKFQVMYDCECKTSSTINSVQVCRKLNAKHVRCNYCKNKEDEKRANHVTFLKTGKKGVNKRPVTSDRKLTHNEKQVHALSLYNAMTTVEKKHFDKGHLSMDEFLNMSVHVISIHGIFISELQYVPMYPSYNQMKITSVVTKDNGITVMQPDEAVLICQCCKNEFNTNRLYKLKGQKVHCRECNLCRKAFYMRAVNNCEGNNVLFQSLLEKKFLDWCEERKLAVVNGPRVPYLQNGKAHIYRVDFQIPSLGILIEVKDMHIWHRQQVESGKWQAKEDAARAYVTSNGLKTFILIMPLTWSQSLQQIINEDIV